MSTEDELTPRYVPGPGAWVPQGEIYISSGQRMPLTGEESLILAGGLQQPNFSDVPLWVEETDPVEQDGWTIRRVKSRAGSKRPFIWQVECPNPPEEPDWDNDFRPARCGCRRFRTKGKALRYVEKALGPDV